MHNAPAGRTEELRSTYVLAFRQSRRETTPDAEQAWSEWFGTIGARVADFGNRVAQTRMLGDQPSGDDELSGYIVVNADSLDAAAEIAGGCPGLRTGGRVEVGTVVPAQ